MLIPNPTQDLIVLYLSVQLLASSKPLNCDYTQGFNDLQHIADLLRLIPSWNIDPLQYLRLRVFKGTTKISPIEINQSNRCLLVDLRGELIRVNFLKLKIVGQPK